MHYYCYYYYYYCIIIVIMIVESSACIINICWVNLPILFFDDTISILNIVYIYICNNIVYVYNCLLMFFCDSFMT